MTAGGVIFIILIILSLAFFIIYKLGYLDSYPEASHKVAQMKARGEDPTPYLNRVFGSAERRVAKFNSMRQKNAYSLWDEYDDPASEEIDTLKNELEAAKNTIVELNIEIAALKQQISKLTEDHHFNRDIFTEFFTAVQSNYSDLVASPEWRADAFVSLYNIYLSHYSEIEKRLSSFVDFHFNDDLAGLPFYKQEDIIKIILDFKDSDLSLSNIKFSASADVDEMGETYKTSLSLCYCEDFLFNGKRPCKHMLALARQLNISWIFGQFVRSEINRSIRYESLTRILKKKHSDVYFRRVCIFDDKPITPSHDHFQHITPDLPDNLIDILKALDKE